MYKKRTKAGYKLIISVMVAVTVCLLGFSAYASVGYLKGKTVRIIGPHSNPGWNPILEEVYSELERKYNFKIEIDLVPWSSYIEKAMMAVRGTEGIYDVVNANGEWVLGSYVVGNSILPLDSFVEKDDYDLGVLQPTPRALTSWPKDQPYKFVPTFWDWENSRLMGLPSSTSGCILAYRQDWFSQMGIAGPPQDYKELLDLAMKLTRDTDGDGENDQWGYSIPGSVRGGQLYDEWAPMLNAWGVNILNEKGKAVFNTPEGVEATQFLVDLYLKYKVVPPGIMAFSQGNNYDLFKTGKLGMVRIWSHNASAFEDPSKSVAAGKTGYSLMPIKQRIGARGMTWAYVIPQNAKDPQLSWEFIKLLSTSEVQKRLIPGGMVPTRIDLLEYIEQSSPEFIAVTLKTLSRKDIMVQAVTPNIVELVDEGISPSIQSALMGETSVEEALNIAQSEVDGLMRDLLSQ